MKMTLLPHREVFELDAIEELFDIPKRKIVMAMYQHEIPAYDPFAGKDFLLDERDARNGTYRNCIRSQIFESDENTPSIAIQHTIYGEHIRRENALQVLELFGIGTGNESHQNTGAGAGNPSTGLSPDALAQIAHVWGTFLLYGQIPTPKDIYDVGSHPDNFGHGFPSITSVYRFTGTVKAVMGKNIDITKKN